MILYLSMRLIDVEVSGVEGMLTQRTCTCIHLPEQTGLDATILNCTLCTATERTIITLKFRKWRERERGREGERKITFTVHTYMFQNNWLIHVHPHMYISQQPNKCVCILLMIILL